MRDIIVDRIAEKLEKDGLWRRAAARWLAVMQKPEGTEHQREWIRRRRNYCFAQLKRPAVEKLGITEINRAATETQVRMGIDRKRS